MATSLDQTSNTDIQSKNESIHPDSYSREEATETRNMSTDGSNAKNGDLVLLEQLKTQIEFYFSPQNMARDTYLRSLMSYSPHYPNGAVPLKNIATFPKVRKLCADSQSSGSTLPPADHMLLKKALSGGSSVAALSADGAWIIPLKFPHPPVAQQHQMMNPHPSQFIEPPHLNALSNQQKETNEVTLMKERTTVILCDVSERYDEQKVMDMFTNDVVTPKSAKPDIGNTWYVVFASEADAIAAVSASKDKTIDGKSIRARVKSETNIADAAHASSSSQHSQSVNAMHPANDAHTSNINIDVGVVNQSLSGQQSQHTGSVSVPYMRADASRIQVHMPHQPSPAGYSQYAHTNQPQYYAGQQQQVYPHHYGMPLHMGHNNSTSPTNYAYATPIQPYAHQGNLVRTPTHQYPYYAAPAQQPKDNYRNDHALYHAEQAVPSPYINHYYHYEVANNLQNNFQGQNTAAGMNNNETYRNGTYGSHGKLNNVPVAAIFSHINDGKLAGKDTSHQKGNKNSGYVRNRHQKNEGLNNNASNLDNYVNKGNITGNGEKKGKKKYNRKKDKINNGNGPGTVSRLNQATSNANKGSSIKLSKDATVLNALNFPELKIDGKPPAEDAKPESNVNVTEDTGTGTSSRGQLTGYAAALLKKRGGNLTDDNI